jgi:hypothetical protein
VAIWASTAATLARAPSISSRLDPARSRAADSRAADSRPFIDCKRSRATSLPGRSVIALLLRSGVGLQETLEPFEVRLGGTKIGLRGCNVGRRGRGTRIGLPDVFGPRACLQQTKLGIGLRAIGLRTLQSQIDIAHVQAGDDISLRKAVAFRDGQVHDSVPPPPPRPEPRWRRPAPTRVRQTAANPGGRRSAVRWWQRRRHN